MVETIINNFMNHLSDDDLKGAESNILKFNSAMKKLGIKNIKIQETITPETIEQGLTINIYPHSNGIEYSERDPRRQTHKELTEYITSLSGTEEMNRYYELSKTDFEGSQTIKITHNNKTYEVGLYIKNINIIILYLPLYLRKFRIREENQYLTQIIKWITEIITEYKIIEVDTKEVIKKRMIKKYMSVIENMYKTRKNNMINEEERIKELQESLIDSHQKLKVYEIDVENLEKNRLNVEEGIIKQIEEIKTLKFVKSAIFGQQGIEIETEEIKIKVKEEEIEMGNYKITIEPSKISIVNNKPIEYLGTIYHSCHIKRDNICFGKEKTLAYELLGKMELKKLAHFLYLYLKTYNAEDTYLSMNYWIMAKKNGGKLTEEDLHKGELKCKRCTIWHKEEKYEKKYSMCKECTEYLKEEGELEEEE